TYPDAGRTHKLCHRSSECLPPNLHTGGFNLFFLFLFHDAATTEIYTLSLHDALPISLWMGLGPGLGLPFFLRLGLAAFLALAARSEEHTSELQSRGHLVCRLLLEKKKIKLNDRQFSINYWDRAAPLLYVRPCELPVHC